MALIKLGAIVTDISGKLGGHVFAKNRGGAYMRTKSTPINPSTTLQTHVRAIFAFISSLWSTLTSAERESWRGKVGQYARTNIFGDLKNPSGKSLFQRLNQNLKLVGLAHLTVCPDPKSVPFVEIDGANADLTAGTVAITALGDTTGAKLMIFATPSLSQGTNFAKNDLRMIGVIDGAVAGNLDIATLYANRFGSMVAGANIVVGVKVVNTNGQSSPLESVKLKVVA